MKNFLLALVAVAALTSAGTVGANAENIILNENNFDSVIGDASKDVFVKFHAPWCGHCKIMKKEWEKLGDMMDESKYTIAELDGSAYRDLALKYNVRSYPTLLLFKKDNKAEPISYKSFRKANDMKNFLLTGKVLGAMY